MSNFSSVNRVKLFTYEVIKIYENHIWELRGEVLYERRSSHAIVDATFAVEKRKPFAVASITAMILVLSYNCLCIVCINVEKLWFIVSSSSESSLTIRCLKPRVPFYDNFHSLQNRKTPLNFLCFSRDPCGITTKSRSFVPATDTVDQRPNVSPLMTFAELTSTFLGHVLYWNIFQILLKGRRTTERKRELKVWSEKK